MEDLHKKMTGRRNTEAERVAITLRKVSRTKAKRGKEPLKCKEKYGREHKTIQDFFPGR